MLGFYLLNDHLKQNFRRIKQQNHKEIETWINGPIFICKGKF